MKRSDALFIVCVFLFMCGIVLTQSYVSQDLTLSAIEAGAYKPADFPNYEQRDRRVYTIPTSSVVAMIAQKSYDYGIDPVTALKIARCESRFDPKAKNSSSTASGLYQFIDKTWDRYCVGDRFDAEDNLDCFLKWYKIKPKWWVCKK